MEYREGIHTDDEKELLELCKILRELYGSVEITDDAGREEIKLNVSNLEIIEGTVAAALDARIKEYELSQELTLHLSSRSYETICPECKRQTSEKPVGEIVLEEGWKHFIFYCKDCFYNYNHEVPNNISDQLSYFENLKKLLNAKDENNIRGYVKKGLTMTQYVKEEKKFTKSIHSLRKIISKEVKRDRLDEIYFESLKEQIADLIKIIKNIEEERKK